MTECAHCDVVRPQLDCATVLRLVFRVGFADTFKTGAPAEEDGGERPTKSPLTCDMLLTCGYSSKSTETMTSGDLEIIPPPTNEPTDSPRDVREPEAYRGFVEDPCGY
jgi:hypothetical protein